MSVNHLGPIVLVEDDEDDSDMFIEVFRSLNIGNSIKLLKTGIEAYEFLIKTPDQPFLIFCDINLPAMNGFELRQKIQENERLRKKSIPFVFLSTTASPEAVNKAYDLTVQGFFKKPATFGEIENIFRMIIDYWKQCRHPNN